jgi:hypothetical protein
VYFKVSFKSILIVALYVGDFLVFANDMKEMDHLKR